MAAINRAALRDRRQEKTFVVVVMASKTCFNRPARATIAALDDLITASSAVAGFRDLLQTILDLVGARTYAPGIGRMSAFTETNSSHLTGSRIREHAIKITAKVLDGRQYGCERARSRTSCR